ncbi:hypothetical protein AT15_00395 [Kosmotoga arenicorallina S304]|uniref:DUF2779 domain-containing protein n=1 Tax=Kosmotoga arenicorallina S304 TaxID=1453497 RepID=A0A176K197_9BACT|nr:DUF2779 domain-containing protein [Kosmotoga arenicorallina]OAA30198.1 hypothetical protein AT15_00395 [Kosmotoga arenicorallina S304]
MKMINKYSFLEFEKCPVRGWFAHNSFQKSELSIAEKFRIRQGIEIGKRARNLFPGGILVEAMEPNEAVRDTSLLLNNQSVETIFEPAFFDDNFIARADMVRKAQNGLEVYEVKSSLSTTSRIRDYIKDLAYTVMVIEDSGYRVSDAKLILVSKDYRKGDEDSKLFDTVDVFNKVCEQKSDLYLKKTTAPGVINSSKRPDGKLSYTCRNCEYLSSCFNLKREFSIFELPRFGKKKTELHLNEGIFYIKDVSIDDLKNDPKLLRVYRAITDGKTIVDGRDLLCEKLTSLQYPIGYLDFETVSTAIPLYNNIAPYERIPYQYSLHVLKKPGWILEHKEFLFSNPSSDETYELAKQLVKDAKECKTLMAHHASTEKSIILWLADRFSNPELSNQLKAMSDLLVDSQSLIENHVYHPEFHGSFSIKKVLPALVKELSYEGMHIHNGDDAQYIFANMALDNYPPGEMAEIRKDMLEYCKLDTLAMVEIHKKLIELAWN